MVTGTAQWRAGHACHLEFMGMQRPPCTLCCTAHAQVLLVASVRKSTMLEPVLHHVSMQHALAGNSYEDAFGE